MVRAIHLALALILATSSARETSAQPSAKTVAELIDEIKARKEKVLFPSAVASEMTVQGMPSGVAYMPTGETRPPQKSKQSEPLAPMVWSVTGINQELSAVLVIDHQVHNVDSTNMHQWIGDWRVRSISERSVVVAHRHGRTLSLPVPDVGTAPDPFLRALRPTDAAEQRPEFPGVGTIPARHPMAGHHADGSTPGFP